MMWHRTGFFNDRPADVSFENGDVAVSQVVGDKWPQDSLLFGVSLCVCVRCHYKYSSVRGTLRLEPHRRRVLPQCAAYFLAFQRCRDCLNSFCCARSVTPVDRGFFFCLVGVGSVLV
ncbi:hypothetical protein DQ04_16481020 [Trypanosoma grayi]|uniref:hypothetical protein n=1 Tax=Trypanosoma grayi TaxID=71804 RepID=UPI0004F3F6DB|nr:hypothetical protein DQ04_16481020 [Trypanosoma grayi]KEG06019.1 hypothetical protein DQ04_16481020 [Trypanosoma grayi]